MLSILYIVPGLNLYLGLCRSARWVNTSLDYWDLDCIMATFARYYFLIVCLCWPQPTVYWHHQNNVRWDFFAEIWKLVVDLTRIEVGVEAEVAFGCIKTLFSILVTMEIAWVCGISFFKKTYLIESKISNIHLYIWVFCQNWNWKLDITFLFFFSVSTITLRKYSKEIF